MSTDDSITPAVGGDDRPPSDDPGSTAHPFPETSAAFLPTKVLVAEVLLLPFFWLAPLLLLGLGGAMALDARDVNEYGVEVGDGRYVAYFLSCQLGHLGSLLYRRYWRRKAVRARLGLADSAATALVHERFPTGHGVRAWFVVQVLAVGGLFALALVGVLEATPDAVALLAFAPYALNLVVGPALAFRDGRRVAAHERVSWGAIRYLHVAVAALPFGIATHLVQRDEHAFYATMIDVRDDDLSSVPAGQSRLARLSDALDDALP